MTDSLGDRMKEYERRETERALLPMLPVYARINREAVIFDGEEPAIAMEARQGGDGETRLHPKDDSAGPQDIAQGGDA